MAQLDPYLQMLKRHGGSDLHFVAGVEPRVRRRGSLESIPNSRVLDDATLRVVLREIASDAQWHDFERKLELDFAYAIPNVARFRVNYFLQGNGIGAVFRMIPEDIKTLDDLAMPRAVEQFAHLRAGLVLVTGPTGSGKSTTLAAIVNTINETYQKHIVTIEDPIEFVHPNKRCIFSQREVGSHTKTFERALRAAIRQNPDVILVGEMRGREVELALSAAEMGALVFGTLHTNSAAKTIDRLIDIFPTDQQDQIRMSLSEALSGVLSQLLIPSLNGGRAAAVEILVKTTALPNIIREGNTTQLLSMMQGGKAVGMQTMDDALEQLIKERVISARDAVLRAHDKSRFEPYLRSARDAGGDEEES
jgi:twitching motility protein PilT